MSTLEVAIDARKARVGADEAVRSIEDIIAAAEKAQLNLRGLGQEFGRTGSSATNAGRQVNRASVEKERNARAADKATRSNNLLTRSFLGLVGGVSASLIIRQSTAAYTQYTEVMSTVQGVTRATAEEFERLDKAARDQGASSKFTATQAGEGLLFLSRAGFDVDKSITALPATLNLAAAGAIGLGEAADFASNILSQFRLEADQTTRVTDVLIATSNRANTDVRQMAEALKYAGTVAGSVDLQLEEVSAAIGVLGDSAIQGSQAGTNLRMIIASLLDPTTEARDAIQGLGLTVDDLNPSVYSLSEIFGLLAKAGLTASEATRIFGVRNVAAALTITNNVERVKELTRVNQYATGEAETMAKVMADNLGGSMKSLSSAVEALQLRTGKGGLGGALREVIDTATGGIRILAGMEDTVTDNILASHIFAQTLKGLGVAAAVAGVLSLVKALSSLSIILAANPVGATIVGVSLLAGALFSLSSMFQSTGSDAREFGQGIEEATASLDRFVDASTRARRARAGGDLQSEANFQGAQTQSIEDIIIGLQKERDKGRRLIPVGFTGNAAQDNAIKKQSEDILQIIRQFGLEADERGGTIPRVRKVKEQGPVTAFFRGAIGETPFSELEPEGGIGRDRQFDTFERTEYINLSMVIARLNVLKEEYARQSEELTQKVKEEIEANQNAARAQTLIDSQLRSLTTQQNELKAAIDGVASSMETEEARRFRVIERVKEYAKEAGLSNDEQEELIKKTNEEITTLEALERELQAATQARDASEQASKRQLETAARAKEEMEATFQYLSRQLKLLEADKDSRDDVSDAMEREQDLKDALSAANEEEANQLRALANANDDLARSISRVTKERTAQSRVDSLLQRLADENQVLRTPVQEQPSVRARQDFDRVLDGVPADQADVYRRRFEELLSENQSLRESQAPGPSVVNPGGSLKRLRDSVDDRKILIGLTREEIDFTKDLQAIKAAAAADNEALTDQQIEDIARYMEQVRRLEDQWSGVLDVTDQFGDAVGKTFTDLISGAASAEEAFESLAQTIIQTLYQRLIGDQIAELVSGVTQGAISSTFKEGHAKGGVINSRVDFPGGYAGEAGPEGILPLKRNRFGQLGVISEDSRSEMMVSVQTAPINITIHNSSRAEVEATEQVGANGERDILLTIKDSVASDVRQRGPVGRAIEEQYGLRPSGVRRSS